MANRYVLPKRLCGLTTVDSTTRLAPRSVNFRTDTRKSRCLSSPPVTISVSLCPNRVKRAIFSPTHAGRLDLDVVEVGRRGCLQSQQSYDPAAQDQEPLCPARMMGEERQADLMHGEIAAPQRRLV